MRAKVAVMTAQSTQNQATHVHELRDGERNFVFHLSDKDIFVRTGRQLIELLVNLTSALSYGGGNST